MSGRIWKDASASFLRARFVAPVLLVVLVAAIVLWLIRGG